MNSKPLRIVFFGTPTFAATILQKMHEAGINIVGVVTAVDKPSGRGKKLSESAVKTMAKSLGLSVFQPEKLKSVEFQSVLKLLNPDLGVIIAFRMLPEIVWNFPPMGTINLHGSLLPQYRGAAPIHHAVINGETTTGVTTFFLKHEIDTGDIIDSSELGIGENESTGELHNRMMNLGADLMINTINQIQDATVTTKPQVFSNVLKVAPKLNREFCELLPEMTACDFHNKIRGLSPSPGAWIKSPWGDMKIFQGRIIYEECTKVSGIQIREKKILIALLDGNYEIQTLQLPGKPKMQALDFINGQKN